MKRIKFLMMSLLVLAIAGVSLVFIGCSDNAGPADYKFAQEADRADGRPSNAMQPLVAPRVTSAHKTEPGAAASQSPRAVPNEQVRARGAQPFDEVWVIRRYTQGTTQQQLDAARAEARRRAEQAKRDGLLPDPGTGRLAAQLPGEKQLLPVPLKHTAVKAQVDAYVATVDVTQQFHNPYASKIEAVYTFPLPQNAAVSDFVMTIGDRRIRGVIREKEEAERIYYAARRQGYVASLMTQHRPNIFTQRVANIEPGKQIDVNVRYYNALAYADGWYEFVFPMVVGPRYNPAGSADPVTPLPRGAATQGRNGTAVTYLKPTERSGHDIALDLTVNAGVPIEQVSCMSHAIDQHFDDDTLNVKLSPRDRVPNKDFVLRFRVAGEHLKSGLIVQRDPRPSKSGQEEGYFTVMLYPPSDLERLERAPVEMIFVLDCSGSMNGVPMEQSKAAMRYALQNMRPDDTFQIIRFSNNASQLGPRPLPATDANLARAMRYVNQLRGQGGTEMIEGIKAALDFPHDPHRLRIVAFLTDGFIGNEKRILGEMKLRLRDARVFSFGVGSSPNRYLLERMAKLGRGTVAYVGHNDDASKIMAAYFERTSHPALTDVQLDFGGAQVSGLYPRRVPDVFVGRPVVLKGKYVGAPPTRVTVRGRAGGRDISSEVSAKPQAALGAGQPMAVPALGAVWARMQIADLMDQATYTNDPHQELAGQIKRIALDYSLMSAYTAFVAVDSSRRTEGDTGTTVDVPVPVPAGVKYETTVGSEREPEVSQRRPAGGVRQ